MTSARVILALMVAASMALADESRPTPLSYLVQSVGPVEVTLAVAGRVQRASVGSPGAGWRDIEPGQQEGRITLQLGAGDLHEGRAIIVLDAPKWLDLNDAEPPAVKRFEVDGKPCTDEVANLGWVAQPPETVVLEVEDAANPIDPRSVRVEYAGRRLRAPDDPGLKVTVNGRRARLQFLPAKADVQPDGMEVSLVLVVDDMALDRTETRRTVTWRQSPTLTMPDGTILTLDSSTSSEGWLDWTVLFDGQVMTEADTTTSNRTWLSEENDQPHWIRFDFPEPRKVAGVVLHWAYYQAWRTSRAYDVQTWDGRKWVTQVEVRDQSERPTSEHRFEPVTTKSLRVWQPPLSGQSEKAKYMWLAEAEVLHE